MRKYHVSYMAVYFETVEANSPEDAAKIVECNCPYDVDGEAHVTDEETGEEWDI